VILFLTLGFKATMAFEECVSKHSENQTLHAGQTAGTGNTSCDFKEFLEGVCFT
jgi:hypothetical protein